ncbi:Mov34/MPN/PAD-1 family protein [Lysobacter sp. ISL-50]|uniref:Mov34/MPN/PAD-1 family protein n=1 Tax=unclassified Lysobacter TaxID=2635362 RepID=UPI001BEB79A8|nr:Mov34/MPN/PAD-1 family protein [Lysobacter sp. ISL-42]MBT2751555.1 Mov34/MPN/PAD-1 family protein [Lysobacter sp. ISL-50]MBT2775749.1 Mov34/MPN/PAD-1 family protein [Lysobacter sp. ISL-54]MBT2782286.1 Mov34/MPN/PAD-1 family protein [Lysobacter sp. ISL-52]
MIDEQRGQAEIKVANAKGLRLIGYWHTHPQRVPELSATDLVSFRTLAARNPIDLPLPVAVIVGRSPKEDGIRAWSIRSEGVIRADHQLFRTPLG